MTSLAKQICRRHFSRKSAEFVLHHHSPRLAVTIHWDPTAQTSTRPLAFTDHTAATPATYFHTRDPIEKQDVYSLYGLCYNNGIDYFDKSALAWVIDRNSYNSIANAQRNASNGDIRKYKDLKRTKNKGKRQ